MDQIEQIMLLKTNTQVGASVYDLNKEKDAKMIHAIGKALSSPIRIKILQELQKKTMNYSELSRMLDLPVGTIAFHISLLKEADLIVVGNLPEHKGHVRWCSYNPSMVLLKLRGTPSAKPKLIHEHIINIGEYVLFEPIGQWGVATCDKVLADAVNNPCIYPKNREQAQILWCHGGRVIYPIPAQLFKQDKIKEIRISLEISSCTLGYSDHYPSNITYKINDTVLCSDISKGDYGDRYGLLTPSTWPVESSKYGVLKTISIKSNGVFINEQLVNNKISLNTISFNDPYTAFFSIENMPENEHMGGFNLFGDKFGDYPQAIKINIFYE